MKRLLFILLVLVVAHAQGQTWTPVGSATQTTTYLGSLTSDGPLKLAVGALAIPVYWPFAKRGTNGLVMIDTTTGKLNWYWQGSWYNAGGTAPVTSVFARTGAIIAQTNDYNTSQVPEGGGNQYFTNGRARLSISGGGAVLYSTASGIASVDSNFSNLYGLVRVDRLTTALSTKQNQLNGTGFVKASGTTITYDNTSYTPATGGTGYIQNGTGTQASANYNIDGNGTVSTLTARTTVIASSVGTATNVPDTFKVNGIVRMVIGTDSTQTMYSNGGQLQCQIKAGNSATIFTIGNASLSSGDTLRFAGSAGAVPVIDMGGLGRILRDGSGIVVESILNRFRAQSGVEQIRGFNSGNWASGMTNDNGLAKAQIAGGLWVQGVSNTTGNAAHVESLSGTALVDALNSGGLKLTNTTTPASPTGGGVIYVESGSLKYRGSSGTITVLGNP